MWQTLWMEHSFYNYETNNIASKINSRIHLSQTIPQIEVKNQIKLKYLLETKSAKNPNTSMN